MKLIWGFCAFFLLAIISSCKQVYNPLLPGTSTNYLVVEGIINTGTDSTIIKLSRTVSLSGKIATKAELKAKLSIESDANTTTYALAEIKNGIYGRPPLNLSKTAKYRLRIITSDNKIYLSDFVVVKESPPIDDVKSAILPEGLQITANTHDDSNDTRYYRWDFEETWTFHSAFNSNYIVGPNNIIVKRKPEEQVYTCWAHSVGTDISLASTAKLTKAVVNNQIITTVRPPAEKLRIRYSILVKQYALTEDAFNFWELLKKNTEQLGSIFDAQPSVIQGNIHNINNLSEPVLGYISAGTYQQKRIFVDAKDMPYQWGYDSYAGCLVEPDTPKTKYIDIAPKDYGNLFNSYSYLVLFPVLGTRPNPITGITDTVAYKGGIRVCSDCTLRGIKNKPVFWTDF